MECSIYEEEIIEFRPVGQPADPERSLSPLEALHRFAQPDATCSTVPRKSLYGLTYFIEADEGEVALGNRNVDAGLGQTRVDVEEKL